MAMPTSDQIVSRYLFNSDVPPSNLIDEGLIRAAGQNGDFIPVVANEYMTTGGGRFAGVERFNYVRNFLAGNDAAYPGSGAGLPPGVYTTTELLRAYGIQDNYKLGLQQYYQGVYDADYAQRAYVFGSCEFKINDDAVFYVNPDGTREIANICVEPVDDDFDYDSTSVPAQVTNYLTEDQIDPSGIGRTVPIHFTGAVSQRYNFTSEDWYTLDVRNQEAQLAENAAIAALATNPAYFAGLFSSVVGSLVGNEIITYEDFANRYVVYDGKDPNNSNPNLDAKELLNFTEMVPFQGVVVVAGGGDDTIFGTDYADEILGGSGNDILDGREGGDNLFGGIGDDTYIIDDPEDWVVEGWNEGTDLVKTDATHVLEGNVENLELTGTESIDATGNDLDNAIKGNSGNNTLDGKAGADEMHGGGGDDIYIVDDEGDTASEEVNNGTDLVKASASHTLGDNIENLELTGTDNIDGTGNDLKNVIKGNSNANTLSGGGGDDQLYGRDGNDILSGGAGKDQLWGEVGSDVINGGDNDDELYGGGESDQLKGDQGSDFIDGGDGADSLKGGADFDIYRADGQDVIEDEDGKGRVHLDGTGVLHGGTRKESDPENEYRDGNTLYLLDGSTLSVNSGLVIQNFTNGDLGINLRTEPDDEDPPDMDEPESRASPLVIDLDGDGVESGSYSRDRYFDHNANGMLESTAWAGGDDGLLVRDINGDGTIDSGRELFGSNTQLESGQLAANGFSALADLDDNHDGVVDANDAAFAELKVWRDANGNGVSEAGELLTLAQAGLKGIRTAWTASSFVDSNNQAHKQVGTAIRTDGSNAAVSDIWFTTDASRRINGVQVSAHDDYLLGDLPDAKAFGNVMDLHQKMALDPAFRQAVETYLAQPDSPQKNSLLQSLIYQWVGVAGIDPNSRGPNIDARQLAVVEALVGRAYRNQYTPDDPVPRYEAGNLLKAEFNEFVQYVDAQLTLQTKYADAGFVKGGFSSGYSHVLVDWPAFKQYIVGLRSESEMGDIAALAAALKALGAYSPTFRLETGAAFAVLSAQYPDIQPLLNGSVTLTGTDGADEMFGTSAQEFITAKKGDDKLYGQGGDDVYLYRIGDGNDTIFDSSGADQLVFMDGILPSNVSLTRDVSAILVTVNVNGVINQIRINNIFEGSRGELREGVIESFRFQSGEVWSLNKILSEVKQLATAGNDSFFGLTLNDVFAGGDGSDTFFGYDGDDTLQGDNGNDVLTAGYGADNLAGGAGDDNLSGEAGDDVLNGGSGNDRLTGGLGNDTYRFSTGFGQDTIDNYDGGVGRLDKIVFEAGIASTDVSIRRSGNSLVLSLSGGDAITVSGHFFNDGEGAYSVNQIRFSDGTVWDAAYLKAAALAGSANSDQLTGYASNDVIHGQGGDDQIAGNGGNDTLYGETGRDTLQGGEGGDTLGGGLDDDRLYGEAGDDILYGDEGADSLSGDAGADRLTGGIGDDRLEGGAGDDSYYFARGDGKDAIADMSGANTIYVSDLTVAEAYLRREGTSLVIRFGSSPNDEIRLESYFDPTTGLALAGLRIHPGAGQEWIIDAQSLDLEVLKATAASDVINGNSLANTINGLLGDDVIRAGGGDDTLSGGDGADSLYGDAGVDILNGDAGADLLVGGEGNDQLRGGEGDDSLDGGIGQDLLTGGLGSDNYIVDDVLDQVVEVAGQGADIIRTSVSYALPANVETLQLVGSGDIDATGNGEANTLLGNDGSNRLEGLAGNDQLQGGQGDDTLLGGAGNDELDGGYGIDALTGGTGDDAYHVDAYADTANELAGEGSDTVYAHSDYALSANIEKLILVEGSGAYQGTGNAGNDIIVGNSSGNRLDGAAGADQLIGGDGDDTYVVDNAGDQVVEAVDEGSDTVESSVSYTLGATLENLMLVGNANLDGTGNDQSNTMIGNAGNNRLDGGLGSDDLYGAEGNDYFITNEIGDWIYEYAGEGLDTVERRFETNLILSDNVENLILATGIQTGNGNELDNLITGNAGDNRIAGLDGDDELLGLDGNDAMWGGGGSDRLIGAAGDDYLDGSEGVDHLEGGIGNDVYITDDPGDVVVEAPGAGTDQVQTTSSYALSANIENLFLMGDEAIDGTGNGLDNYIAGNSAVNVLNGMGGSDTMVADAGNDTLIGGTGDDKYVMDAGSGSDVVDNTGGGNDGVFFTDGVTRERLSFSRDGNDLLITIDNGTTPAVRVTNHFLGGDAAIDYVQPDGGFMLTTAQINQIVAGGGTGYDQVIEGTAAGEQLVGGSGKDLIKGLAGNDELFGMGGNDTLQGGDGDDYLAGGNGSGTGSGADRLEGGVGNDTLSGEEGANVLIGGANDDSYVYGGGQDTIDNTGGGYDGVFFNDGITAARMGFTRDGDDLVITVDANANTTVRVTGHFLGGDYAIDFVQPASGAMLDTAAINALVDGGNPPGGGDGDYPSVVTGTAAGEQLVGTNGRDLIKGLGGADQLFGFSGDDKLDGGDGDDYLSGGNGSAANTGNDILIGGAGVDTLVGEDGNDQMFGGIGNDKYVYGGGADTIDNTGGGTDWLFFNSSAYSVVRSRITFHRDGDDLIVRVDADAAKQVRVTKHFLGGEYTLAYVQPAGGNAIPASQFGALLAPLQSAPPMQMEANEAPNVVEIPPAPAMSPTGAESLSTRPAPVMSGNAAPELAGNGSQPLPAAGYGSIPLGATPAASAPVGSTPNLAAPPSQPTAITDDAASATQPLQEDTEDAYSQSELRELLRNLRYEAKYGHLSASGGRGELESLISAMAGFAPAPSASGMFHADSESVRQPMVMASPL